MRMRVLWRCGLVLSIGWTLVATTGCGRWSWRDRHGEIEYDHDGYEGHAPGHVNHPHGGPPGQMKKQGNSGPEINVEIN